MAIFKRDKDKAEKDVKIGNRFFPTPAQQAEYEKAKKELAELPSYGSAIVSNSLPVHPADLKVCKLIGTTGGAVLVRRGEAVQAYNLANYKPTEGELTLFDLVVSYYKAVNRDEE